MLTPQWQKSSFSGTEGSCVEVRLAPGGGGRVQLRDSKDPDGPALTFDAAALVALVDEIKDGNLHG